MNTEHRTQLDGLRCLAVMLVFVFHAYVNRIGYLPIGEGLNLVLIGSLGVQIFFVISGFLITRQLLTSETGDFMHDLRIFYIRRILRIFPLYYAVLILLTLTGYLLEPIWFYTFLFNYRAFQGDSGGPASVYWSLCIEEQFYLFIPFLLLKTPTRWRLHLLIAVLLMFFVIQYALDLRDPKYMKDYIYLLPESGHYLLWGCIAGYVDRFCEQKNKSPSETMLFVLGLLLTPILLLMMAYFPRLEFKYYRTPLIMLQSFGMSLLVLGLWRTQNKLLLGLFKFPPFAYLGKISYGFYLFHSYAFTLSQHIYVKYPQANAIDYVLGTFLLTFAAASLSWHFFESPINKLKRHFPLGAPKNGDATNST